MQNASEFRQNFKKRGSPLSRPSQTKTPGKNILIALLKGNSCTPETLKFVIGELNDPAYAYDLSVSILANVKPPPLEVLPIMVQKFAHSDDPGEREFLAQAMALYGNRAKTYLPVVQEMLSKETDPIARQNLQRAADSLKDSPKGH